MRAARGLGSGRVALLALGCLPAVLCGCGSSERVGDRIRGSTLTIYASLPLEGDSSAAARAIRRGERWALSAVRGRIGRYHIVLRELDDATPQRAAWDPGQTTANARLAASDPRTIGYLGEFNSGASAIAIPLLNRAGIAQISPTSTAAGLTSGGSGSSPGEPQKYYPTGVRTFARVVPNAAVQGIAQARLQRGVGCKGTLVLDDGEVDASDTATSFQLAAQSLGLPVVGVQAFAPGAADYSSLVLSVPSSGADCVLISALSGGSAALLTRQLAKAMPQLQVLMAAGDTDSTFADSAAQSTASKPMLVTLPGVQPSPTARFVLSQSRGGALEPYSLYGYEAMALMLDAITRATKKGSKPALRSKVRHAIFATRGRHSVLGTYSIGRNGDTSLREYGVYTVVGGRLKLREMVAG